MTLFRNRKDGHLYLIYLNSPRQYTGSWYRAEPYLPNQGKTIKNAKLSDFDVVSGKPREPQRFVTRGQQQHCKLKPHYFYG